MYNTCIITYVYKFDFCVVLYSSNPCMGCYVLLQREWLVVYTTIAVRFTVVVSIPLHQVVISIVVNVHVFGCVVFWLGPRKGGVYYYQVEEEFISKTICS